MSCRSPYDCDCRCCIVYGPGSRIPDGAPKDLIDKIKRIGVQLGEECDDDCTSYPYCGCYTKKFGTPVVACSGCNGNCVGCRKRMEETKKQNIESLTGDKDFDALIQRALDILKTKSLDYATDKDRLAEIRATSEMTGVTMRQTLGVYMNKHLRSVFKWLRGEELLGEPIEEKLVDIIVYALLGYKICVEENKLLTPE